MNEQQNEWVNDAVNEWSDLDFNLNPRKNKRLISCTWGKPGEIMSS